MELTLFVKRSNHPVANSKKTIKSLKHKEFKVGQILFIDKFENIVYEGIDSEWYMILYDNERLDEQLLEAIPVLMMEERTNVFAFYKKDLEDRVSICPRLFRKKIELNPKVLYPINERESITNVLNGFVREHD